MSASPSTTTLLDVIVLVFSKSELKSLVGTDALKTVLEGQQRAMFSEPGTMNLQPVWELLESQPGFDPEKAVAPFCRLKTWEARLKTKVVMPTTLEVLDQRTCEMRAMNVNAFDSDLDKLLAPPAQKQAVPVARVIESSTATAVPTTSNKRVKIAMAIAFIGIAAVAVSFYLTFAGGGGNTVRLAPAELTDTVPIDNIRKSGDVIVATLMDPAWLGKPEADRRTQLGGIVPKMRAQGVRTLLLVDARNNTLGSIMIRGAAPVISFIPQRPPKKK